MISETISHYKVLDKLGSGGMGEVYRARDTRLGRSVALKFLPACCQYDPQRRASFMLEARAASALRSPNVAAIYDIGEDQGAMFIVMECVEGESLAQRIERGSLAPAAVTHIGEQIAAALEEAHSLGIVHRDIKSSNLMIDDRGLVKVLDFGIARIVAQASPDGGDEDVTVVLGEQTRPGAITGTIAYMSPEQALGRDVDFRSDIFSLGVVLYELSTGKRPFGGAAANEIIDNILHQETPAFAGLNRAVAAELERITRKCLEKDRERRYQSAAELLADLREAKRDSAAAAITVDGLERQNRTARSGRRRKVVDAIAVLPLANDSGDSDLEYLCDGITEAIINNLAQLPKLRVMARSTVFHYKGQSADPREVGRELAVRAVLTGRVLSRGDQLVIKVEMVDAGDGSHLWGAQYNRKPADIFAIEEEISREISENLRIKLTGAQKKNMSRRRAGNAQAYQDYLRGRFHWNKRSEEGLKRSIEYFQKAIDSDPEFALAYAGLADAYMVLVTYNSLAPAQGFPKAKAAAARALEMNEDLPEAHTSLAFVRFGYDWDWAGAAKEFKRALELGPGCANAHQWSALFHAAMGRFDQALNAIEKAHELDPLSLPIATNKGWILYLARRYDAAIEQYQKAIELDPNFSLAHQRLGQAYEQRRMYEKARAEYKESGALVGERNETVASRGFLFGLSGDRERAEATLNELRNRSAHTFVPAYLFARVYMGLGDNDRAFEWLEKACEERYGLLTYLRVEPAFDSLREDPRLEELAARVGLPGG